MVSTFLKRATEFALSPIDKKTEVIQSFSFVPPNDPLLQVDDKFHDDVSMEVIQKQVANFCRKHEMPNPFFNHFEGVQGYIQTYCKQFAAGEMEKGEVKQKILSETVQKNYKYFIFHILYQSTVHLKKKKIWSLVIISIIWEWNI